MESFDFAVGLWPVGAGLLRRDPEVCAGIAPRVQLVGGAVVREDTFDGDAAVGEPGHCSTEDTDRGFGSLVGADLGVGEAGVVVDDGVHERGAQPGLVTVVPALRAGCGRLAVAFALDAADESPAAAVGNVAELGDVDVDQRPGMIMLVTADRFPGDSVDVAEPIDPATLEHRVDSRRRQAELTSDLHGTQPAPPSRIHDPLDHRRRCLGRHRAWTAGSISHPCRALGAGPRRPLAGSDGRDHEYLRRDRRRPPVIDDQARQAQTSARSESSVSVGHEGLLVREAVS